MAAAGTSTLLFTLFVAAIAHLRFHFLIGRFAHVLDERSVLAIAFDDSAARIGLRPALYVVGPMQSAHESHSAVTTY
jgi:hypothetical protein